MAITVDNAGASAAATTAATTVTISGFAVGSGEHRYLRAGISVKTGTNSVISITYGGVNLTKIIGQAGSTDPLVELWGLADPAVGSADLVATIGSADQMVLGAASYFGVDGGHPWRDTAGAAGNDTSPTVTVTSVGTGDLVVDVLAKSNNSGDTLPSLGADQTQEWRRAAQPIVGSGVVGAGSNQAGTVSPATMSWSLGTARAWTMVAGALVPFVLGSDPS